MIPYPFFATRSPSGVLLPALLALAGASSACSPTPDDPPTGSMVVDLLIEPDAVTVLSTDVAGSVLVPPVRGAALEVELLDEDGAVVARAEAADPRTYLAENLDEAGVWTSARVAAGFGGMRAVLPARAGTVVVRELDGTEIGRAEATPPVTESTGALRLPLLLFPEDVLGTEQLRDGGPFETALDIVFVSEGYTEAELPSYRAAVADIVAGLEARSDYGPIFDRITINRVDVRSRESFLYAGGNTDTAFDIEVKPDGLIWFKSQDGLEEARSRLFPVRADVSVVIVNTSVPSGGGYAENVIVFGFANVPYAVDVVGHELGHALFNLDDEYSPTDGCDRAVQLGPNISRSAERAELPWRVLVDDDVPLPTPSDPAGPHAARVGAFEGARYCETGLFRSSLRCNMNGLGELCPVCRCSMQSVLCELDARASCTIEDVCAPRLVPPGEGGRVTVTGAVEGTGTLSGEAAMSVGPDGTDWQLTLATEDGGTTGTLDYFTVTAFVRGTGPLAPGTYEARDDRGGCLVLGADGVFSSPAGSRSVVRLDSFSATPSVLGGHPVTGSVECTVVDEGVEHREATVRADF